QRKTSTIDVAVRAASRRRRLQHLRLHSANADVGGPNHSANPRASTADNIAAITFVVHSFQPSDNSQQHLLSTEPILDCKQPLRRQHLPPELALHLTLPLQLSSNPSTFTPTAAAAAPTISTSITTATTTATATSDSTAAAGRTTVTQSSCSRPIHPSVASQKLPSRTIQILQQPPIIVCRRGHADHQLAAPPHYKQLHILRCSHCSLVLCCLSRS
ncbi:unnamed protein product, partial [Closterium sp. NIES-54]